jgi:arylsulfatase A-like enzyme
VSAFGLASMGYAFNSCSSKCRKPSILFLLTDDQRYDALSCAGNPIIQTPNMDWLAQNGMRFENAFVTTPICAASCASIFTGLYERKHDYTFTKPPIRKEYTDLSYPILFMVMKER